MTAAPSVPGTRSSAQLGADAQAIEQVLRDYCYGLDARDYDLLLACFTEDASANYLRGHQVVKGQDELLELFKSIERFDASNHAPSNIRVTMGSDEMTATSDTFLVASLLDGRSGRILFRGIRYLDQFARTPEGWRIRDREMYPTWQSSMSAEQPQLPADTWGQPA